MANANYEDYDEPSATGPSRMSKVKSGVSTAIGAVAALAILFTLGVWFYRLGVRDAQNVPIIRAAAQPAKTRPEDPGGVVTPHQDVSSYEVAEAGEATAGAAVIAPPPPEPDRDDVAMGELSPTPQQRPTVLSEAEVSAMAQEFSPAPAASTQPESAPRDEQIAALTPSPTPQTAAVTPAQEDEDVAAPASQPIEPAEVALTPPVEEELQTEDDQSDEAATGAAPRISPIAPKRPKNLLARVDAAAVAAEREVVDLAAKAASSPFQIQLAADPDQTTIRQMWQRVQAANADVLRDRALAVQTTLSGGTTFYRLRVGPFATRSEAAAVCQALKSRGQDCIVARNS